MQVFHSGGCSYAGSDPELANTWHSCVQTGIENKQGASSSVCVFPVMQAEQKRHLHSAFGRPWSQEGEPNRGRKQGDKIRGLCRLKLVCCIWRSCCSTQCVFCYVHAYEDAMTTIMITTTTTTTATISLTTITKTTNSGMATTISTTVTLAMTETRTSQAWRSSPTKQQSNERRSLPADCHRRKCSQTSTQIWKSKALVFREGYACEQMKYQR